MPVESLCYTRYGNRFAHDVVKRLYFPVYCYYFHRGYFVVFLIPLKKLLLYWLIGLVFLLLLSGCDGSRAVSSPTPGTNAGYPTSGTQLVPIPTPVPSPIDLGIRRFIDTWNNIHSFLTFDYDISNPAAIAKHYDFVWGANPKNVAAFRSANPNIFLAYYILFHRDNGTFSDNGAYHDLNYWKAVHPDWILYKCDRVTPAYEFGDPNVPFDFTNPAVISWQIQTYIQPASTSGYDGIAADNVNLQNLFGACGYYVHGKWVQRYTGQVDDPQWTADVITWLTQMQQALHHLKHPLALIPNLSIGDLFPDDPSVLQVLSHVDGVLDESGFTRFGDGYLTDGDWLRAIQFIEAVQQQNKPYYIINQFPSVSRTEIQWALASYLMGKEHSAAMYISTVQGYGGQSWYSEYNAQIGSPSGPMYEAQGIYIRAYTHGLSLVNPSNTYSYTVTLDAGTHYKDLYGHPIAGTVTLPPHSGLVLLSNS